MDPRLPSSVRAAARLALAFGLWLSVETPRAAAPPLRLVVREDGLYRVTATELRQAGWPLEGADPGTLALSNQGRRVPVVWHAETSQAFSERDYVLFYGQAATGIYTRENTYWLTLGGAAGARMRTRDGTPRRANPVQADFVQTLRLERDTHYWQAIPNGAGQDHWFWDGPFTAPETREYPFPLAHLAGSVAPATLRVSFRGLSAVAGVAPDHHVGLSVNGVPVGDARWDGQAEFEVEVTFASELLVEGENTLRIETPNDTGALVDQVFLNRIELLYPSRYVPRDGALTFAPRQAGRLGFAIGPYATDDAVVFDLAQPGSPVQILHGEMLPGAGGWTLEFEDTASDISRYLALTADRFKVPARLELDVPSSWSATTNQADYLVITHASLYDAALTLARHRAAQGLRVATVPVQDIYDEWNDGNFDPAAIRRFLRHVLEHWRPPVPAYVLLVGDACQDYLDNFGTGSVNYVPSQIIETAILGQTPSDHWFALANDDDVLPAFHLGRLPVQSAGELEAFTRKLIAYERDAAQIAWASVLLLVADDDDPVFEANSEALAAVFPADTPIRRVYTRTYPPGDPAVALQEWLDAGSVFVNYFGHGSVDGWGLWRAEKRVFDSGRVGLLQNLHRPSIVTMGDCLSGFFVTRQTRSSLAEDLLHIPDKGAVAVWAPTAYGYANSHRILLAAFYQALNQAGTATLGQAIGAAQLAAYAQDPNSKLLIRTFTLLGDPATRVVSPTAPDPPVLHIARTAADRLELVFPVRPGWDYVLASRSALAPEEVWSPLPDPPHNTGRVAVDPSAPAQYYRVSATRSQR